MQPGSATGQNIQQPMMPPGLEKYSREELLKFAERMERGDFPSELAVILGQPAVGPDGKPVVDAEGGVTIQPL